MSAGQPTEILVDRARIRKRIRMIIFYNHKKKSLLPKIQKALILFNYTNFQP